MRPPDHYGDGSDYPFDLRDLRALDTRLANACVDYLYDRLGKRDVHRHVTGGRKRLHRWVEPLAQRDPVLDQDKAIAAKVEGRAHIRNFDLQTKVPEI